MFLLSYFTPAAICEAMKGNEQRLVIGLFKRLLKLYYFVLYRFMTAADWNRSAKAGYRSSRPQDPHGSLYQQGTLLLLGWAPPLAAKTEILPGGSISYSID